MQSLRRQEEIFERWLIVMRAANLSYRTIEERIKRVRQAANEIGTPPTSSPPTKSRAGSATKALPPRRTPTTAT